jgi:hypothetical protein
MTLPAGVAEDWGAAIIDPRRIADTALINSLANAVGVTLASRNTVTDCPQKGRQLVQHIRCQFSTPELEFQGLSAAVSLGTHDNP